MSKPEIRWMMLDSFRRARPFTRLICCLRFLDSITSVSVSEPERNRCVGRDPLCVSLDSDVGEN